MTYRFFFIGEHEFLLKTPAPAEVLPRDSRVPAPYSPARTAASPARPGETTSPVSALGKDAS